MSLTSVQIRERFLNFFEKRGHSVVPSAPLVPKENSSVLFNTAGMQPLIPYLLGEKHPAGTRLVNSQKCVRTQDILEVGDNTHDTFFEMLGNWSLGDYFKKEAIEWSYEFLTSKTEGLGLDPNFLYVTCFEGNMDAPRDEESAKIWKDIFKKNNIQGERIYFRPAEKNWWSVGDDGPCGPDTEMFYDTTGTLGNGMTLDEYIKADDEQKVVEIWNDVFMEYLKKDGKVVSPLSQKNVDTGSGLERLVMVVQGKNNIFDTDLFSPIMEEMAKKYGDFSSEKSKRITADHVRTAVFMMADGVTPSNSGRGYILRRLLRRAIFQAWKFTPNFSNLYSLTETVVKIYDGVYPELEERKKEISDVVEKEESKFLKTIKQGEKEFEKISRNNISGVDAFNLSSTFGFPFDLIKELAKDNGVSVDEEGFNKEFKKHQELSRKGGEEKFKPTLS
jgi:alanyl-tRNA synthetase